VFEVYQGGGPAASEYDHYVPHAELFQASICLDGTTGIMAREHGTIGRKAQEALIGIGLPGMHIWGDGGDVAGFKGVGESVLVDKGPTGYIDEALALAKVSNTLGGDDKNAAGRRAEDDAVAHGEKVFERVLKRSGEGGFDAAGLVPKVVVVDVHAEG
jgi:hypothetical protein